MENIWRFDNSYAKNVAHFGVNNSSPSYPNNRINNFSVLKVGEIFHINSSFGAPDTKFSISFTNLLIERQNFALVYATMW